MQAPPPTLNNVLYLVADNGYAAEVCTGSSLAVNRDAWSDSDERLLRTLGRIQYDSTTAYGESKKVSRLQHAVLADDGERRSLLRKFTTTAIATDALTTAREEGKGIAVTDEFVAVGADVSACLETCSSLDTFSYKLSTDTAVLSALCGHASMAPDVALRASLVALSPALVRTYLVAGMAAWSTLKRQGPSSSS